MIDLIPVSLQTANEFVAAYHRHHKPVTGHKFSIGATDGEKLVGVVIVGRPVGRYLDDGYTLEVNRLCTDGTRNVCSLLYSAAARVAKDLGYNKIVTYILESECGASLRASGWECEGTAGGTEWTGVRKPKDASIYPHEMKKRWSKTLRVRDISIVFTPPAENEKQISIFGGG